MPEDHTSTKLIPPLSDERIRRAGLNAFQIRKREIKDWKPIATYKDANVYTTGTDGAGYYFLERNSSVIYFVHYKMIKGGGLRFGRQILVWRDSADIAASGFAKHIFWERLLPRFKALISDTQQTPNGKAFWGYMIDEAFSRGTPVYFYDRSSNPNRLIQIEDLTKLRQHDQEIWGTSNRHLQTHAVISEVPLQLKGK